MNQPSRDGIKILKANQVYRVSDLVLCKGVRWQQDHATILEDPEFHGSILHDYLKEKSAQSDMAAFKRVVDAHKAKYEKPAADTLVIHLRLGDIMDDGQDWRTYKKYKNVYGALPLEPRSEVDKATIVTALHFGANPVNGKYFYSDRARDRSFEVLQLLTEDLQARGFEVSYKSSENIDEDICFMAGSRYFVKALSELSNLIFECLPPGTLVWSPKGDEVIRT
jgi:hypothetical protein